MLKLFRAEHILAIFVTAVFLLCDIAVLCFFVTSADTVTDITPSSFESAEHRVIQTPEFGLRALSSATFGGNTGQKAEAVKQLEDALNTQLQTLTQTKNVP